MLDTSNIQWTDDCGADGLFSSPTNYELCHSLFSPNKNAVQIGDYFDTRIFAEQGFEGWNTDSSRLVQPRSIPELNLSTIGQPSHAYPPSAFHVDAKPSEGSHQEEDTNVDTTLLDIQRSVEQDANVHANQEAYPLDLGAPALSFGHFNDLRSSHRHSPTSMLSEFSGDHGEHFDYDEMDEDNEKPYAQLIYQALLTAKDYSMQLQDIYDWIQHRTDKVKDKSGQGWRNSIRHNLSMNKVRLYLTQ